MVDPQKGFWILPTKGHVRDRLPEFLKSAVAAGMTTPGFIVIDEAEFDANKDDYLALAQTLPDGWDIEVSHGAPNTAGSTQWAWNAFGTDVEWCGWLSDDLKCETDQWDTKTLASLNGMNFVSTNDAVFAPRRMNGATAWSGDLVRAVGYLYAPGFKHFYFDDMWEHLGRMLGIWKVDMSILVRHEHDMVTGRLDRMRSPTNAFFADDERAFHAWKKNDMHIVGDRIVEMMMTKGVRFAKHDTRGVNLMIAVPSADRKYDGRFMISLLATMDYVRRFGGEAQVFELPYCSDVVIARTSLLSAFRRSTCTHMMNIDDDMGWNPADVLKLLTYKKDFVAVAGPRKVSPPSFAVSINDEWGNPGKVEVDPITGLFTGDLHVGMAFTLLSKEGVERMCQHYTDLAFVSASGTEEVCVFMPMIVNRRYLSEDFSYCRRWRLIGGEVFIDATISLDHVGMNVWTGTWLEHLQLMNQRQAAA